MDGNIKKQTAQCFSRIEDVCYISALLAASGITCPRSRRGRFGRLCPTYQSQPQLGTLFPVATEGSDHDALQARGVNRRLILMSMSGCKKPKSIKHHVEAFTCVSSFPQEGEVNSINKERDSK